jgi:hypothetical protein
MDLITELRNLSMKELLDLIEDIKNNPDRHTVLEAKMVQYLKEDKFTVDFLDRNVGKAPTEIKGEIKAFTVNDMRKLFNKNPDSKPEEYKEDE